MRAPSSSSAMDAIAVEMAPEIEPEELSSRCAAVGSFLSRSFAFAALKTSSSPCARRSTTGFRSEGLSSVQRLRRTVAPCEMRAAALAAVAAAAAAFEAAAWDASAAAACALSSARVSLARRSAALSAARAACARSARLLGAAGAPATGAVPLAAVRRVMSERTSSLSLRSKLTFMPTPTPFLNINHVFV